MTVVAAIAIFALFLALGSAFESDRGQAGLLIAPAIVAATALADRVLSPAPWRDVFTRLGFVRPATRGLIGVLVVSVALVAFVPLYGFFTHGRLAMYPGWLWLLPGLFAQGGIAEETLFRGFLYRRYRGGRTFHAAVAASSVPFALAHAPLLLTMPLPFAAAAVSLALLTAAPLAHAFESGGGSVWTPAILHFVIQGGIKVMTLTGGPWAAGLPFAWMIACAILPYGLFLVFRRGDSSLY